MERIIQSARELLAEKVGISEPASEVFRSLLLDPAAFRSALLEAASSDANAARTTASPDADRELAPLWQLPLFFHEGARLPKLAKETVLDRYPEHINSSGKKRIALFVGCSINHVHTDIADSAIETLKKLDVDVFLPDSQLCCGAPALLFGDKDAARELARRNLAALKSEEFDAVVTLCPACGTTFKREYGRILGDEIGDFASKVCDISEFIDKNVDYKAHRTDTVVTYHDPCYLKLGQEVEAEPRRMLDSTGQFVEMENAGECCGLGCTLGIFHPEASMKMGEAKVKAIMESGADVVATGCPGCIIFLKEMLAREGLKKNVLHTVQVFQRGIEA